VHAGLCGGGAGAPADGKTGRLLPHARARTPGESGPRAALGEEVASVCGRCPGGEVCQATLRVLSPRRCMWYERCLGPTPRDPPPFRTFRSHSVTRTRSGVGCCGRSPPHPRKCPRGGKDSRRSTSATAWRGWCAGAARFGSTATMRRSVGDGWLCLVAHTRLFKGSSCGSGGATVGRGGGPGWGGGGTCSSSEVLVRRGGSLIGPVGLVFPVQIPENLRRPEFSFVDSVAEADVVSKSESRSLGRRLLSRTR
jgi:hypothetical protein